MNEAEARALLLKQVEPDNGTGAPQTFLGGLRPYRGKLPRKQFHDTMDALRVLAPSLGAGDAVDRTVISALWTLCDLTRRWALDEHGMLRRNSLISNEDLATLTTWHDMISYAVSTLLEGGDPGEAFHEYDHDLRPRPDVARVEGSTVHFTDGGAADYVGADAAATANEDVVLNKTPRRTRPPRG
jgi:hypothetical protein